jgi:hypothetical protein
MSNIEANHIDNLEETIRSLKELVEEKNLENARKDQEIAEKDQEISLKNVEIGEKNEDIQTLLDEDSAAIVTRLMDLHYSNMQKIAKLEDEIEKWKLEVRKSKEERAKKDIVTINNLYQEIIRRDQEIAKKNDKISQHIGQGQEISIIKLKID